jgi:hypothetical protein
MAYPREFHLAAVDVFGTRVSEPEVLALVSLEAGARIVQAELRARCDEATRRLESEGRWAFAHVSCIDYFEGPEAGRSYVTVDLVDCGDEERLRFDPTPTGHIDDPLGLVAAWRQYEQEAWDLLRAGQLDLDQGPHSRALHYTLGFGHPTLLAYDERFAADVPPAFEQLAEVLRNDADLHNRGAAAFLLAYGSDAQRVADLELERIRDPSSFVRNNTLRVLCLLPERARQPVQIAVEPLVDALSFPTTTDRNKAAAALAAVLRQDPSSVALVSARGRDALERMAALQQPNNREFALELLRLLDSRTRG